MKDPNKITKAQIQKAIKRAEKEADIAFAKAVKDRDGWKCIICGTNENLHCHHILPRERKDIRHDLINGATLCCLHHKFSLLISPHKNAFEFFIWLQKNRFEQYCYLKSKAYYNN